MSIFLTTDFLNVYLPDFLTILMSVYLSECLCLSAVIVILILLSQGLRLQGFFFSHQKQTNFNRKRLNLYTEKLLYLHLPLNVLDD